MDPIEDSEFLDTLLETILQDLETGREPVVATLTAERPHLVPEVRRLIRTLRDVNVIGAEAPPTLPGFTVTGEVGRGGMGRVYLASQDRLGGRPVALKVWHRAGGAGDAAVEQLRAEASALARVRHPGVVTVHDVLAYEGSVAIAMEWVEGATLAGVIDAVGSLQGPARDGTAGVGAVRTRIGGTASAFADASYTAWVCRVCLQVARALGAAHLAGVLHRDVKPSNILLRKDGVALLSDFGLATLGEGAAPASGRFAGTLAYAAPEQVAGDAVDRRSDIYALGATLYHALALRAPHRMESSTSTGEIPARSTAAHLRSIDLRIAPDLEAIVEKAMAEQPSDRYAGADEMADDLERLLRLEPVRARPSSAAYVARKFVARNRLAVGAALAVIIALAAGLAAALVGLKNAIESKHKADESAAESRLSAAQSRVSAYVASIQAASAELRADEVTLAARQLDGAPEDFRGWEWRYLHGQLDRTLGAIYTFPPRPDGDNPRIAGLAMDPGGQWMAAGSGDGRLAVFDLHQNGHRPSEPPVSRVVDLREMMSFDICSLVLHAASGTLVVGEWHGPRVLYIHPQTLHVVRSFSLGPEHHHVATTAASRGDLLAVWAVEGNGCLLQIRSVATDEVLARWSWPEQINCVRFLKGDDELVVKGERASELVNWRSGQRVPLEVLVDGSGQGRDHMTVSPDGSGFAFSSHWLTQVWSSGPPRPIVTLAAQSSFKGQRLAFSPDGGRLYCYEGPRIRGVEVGTTKQVLAVRSVYVRTLVSEPLIAHDGRFLYSGHDDGAVRVWSTETPDEPLVFSCPESGAISPDFTLVACRAEGPNEDRRRVQIKAAATGAVVQDFVMGRPDDLRLHRFFVFSPDSRWLVRLMDDNTHADPLITAREIATGASYERALAPPADARIAPLCFLLRPDRLVAATGEGLEVLSLPTLTVLQVIPTPGPVMFLSSAKNGARYAVTTKLPDGTLTVQIRDGSTHSVLREIPFGPPGEDQALNAYLSPDGTLLVTIRNWDGGTGSDKVELVDAVSGEFLAAWTGGHVRGIAFDPSGTRMAFGLIDGTIRVIAIVPMPDQKPALAEVLSLRGGSWMIDPFFSDDGARLGCVTVYPNNRCLIWDARPEAQRFADRERASALTPPGP